MNVNRKYSVVLAIGLILGLLVSGTLFAEGTQEESQTGAKKELSFWHFYSAGAQEEAINSMLDEYIKNHPEIEFVTQSVPSKDYLGTKLPIAFASGEGPDMFLTAPPLILQYLNSGVLYPIGDLMTQEQKDDFSEHYLNVSTFEGKIYGVPLDSGSYGFYYDKALFDSEGLEGPSNWVDLMQLAKKLTTDKRYGIQFHVGNDDHLPMVFSPFLWSTGADYFTADRKHSGLNHPGAAKALQFWKDLMKADVLNPSPSRRGNNIGILADGEAAMQLGGVWSIFQLEADYPDRIKEIEALRIPIPAGGQHATCVGGWSIVVNGNSDNAEDAARFALWLGAGDVQTSIEWSEEVARLLPVRESVRAAVRDDYVNRPGGRLFQVWFDKIMPTERPEVRAPSEVIKIIREMIQEALFDDSVTGEQTAKRAHQKLEQFLKEFEGSI